MVKYDINKLVQNLIASLPEGAKNLPQDLAQNFREILQAQFNKMDLVTREEFDAQVKVLHRTRQKLQELEKLLQEKHK